MGVRLSWLLEPICGRSISIFQYLNISIFQYFNISIFQYLNISISQYFNISIFQYFNISIFPSNRKWAPSLGKSAVSKGTVISHHESWAPDPTGFFDETNLMAKNKIVPFAYFCILSLVHCLIFVLKYSKNITHRKKWTFAWCKNQSLEHDSWKWAK